MSTEVETKHRVNQGGAITIEYNQTPFNGTVVLDGGKHGFSHDVPVAALANEGTLLNVPNITDANTLIDMLKMVFKNVEYSAESHILNFLEPFEPRTIELSDELLSKSRSLFGCLPAILSHGHTVKMEGLPAGCNMGDRPTDWYFETLEKFGVKIQSSSDEILLTWEDRHPADITFEYPTMTGTVIAIAAASVVDGVTSLHSASVEPSCIEELNCVASMGIKIEGVLPEIKITGLASIPQVEWRVLHDRVHACTYLTAGLLTRGKVTVRADKNIDIPQFVKFLKDAGVTVEDRGTSITAEFPEKGYLEPVRVDAGSEPLFSSDWIAPLTLLLATRSKGKSIITDNVFPDRLQCLENLKMLGMDNVKLSHTTINGRRALYAEIDGQPDKVLRGGDVGYCSDLRGSTALALVALVANEPVHLSNDFHLRRGYEDLPGTLKKLQEQSKAKEEA